MTRFYVAVFFTMISMSFSSRAAESGTLRLSGQVDPQLNVSTSLDWTNGMLRFDNASNVENDTYWIEIGSSERVKLERSAVVDLASWIGRNRIMPGKQFLVTIASP